MQPSYYTIPHWAHIEFTSFLLLRIIPKTRHLPWCVPFKFPNEDDSSNNEVVVCLRHKVFNSYFSLLICWALFINNKFISHYYSGNHLRNMMRSQKNSSGPNELRNVKGRFFFISWCCFIKGITYVQVYKLLLTIVQVKVGLYDSLLGISNAMIIIK